MRLRFFFWLTFRSVSGEQEGLNGVRTCRRPALAALARRDRERDFGLAAALADLARRFLGGFEPPGELPLLFVCFLPSDSRAARELPGKTSDTDAPPPDFTEAPFDLDTPPESVALFGSLYLCGRTIG